jgi:hypothetical protein
MQISTVNRPSTWLNGPVEVPQKEQFGPTPRLLLEHLFERIHRELPLGNNRSRDAGYAAAATEGRRGAGVRGWL